MSRRSACHNQRLNHAQVEHLKSRRHGMRLQGDAEAKADHIKDKELGESADALANQKQAVDRGFDGTGSKKLR